MQELVLNGKIEEIYPKMQVSERFAKREVVINNSQTSPDGTTYPSFAKVQFTQNRCDVLDNFRVGDEVAISFNVRGNKWEKDGKVNYITTIEGWRINKVVEQNTPQQNQIPQTNNTPNPAAADDLPF